MYFKITFKFFICEWAFTKHRTCIDRLSFDRVFTESASVSSTGTQEGVALCQHMQLETCACTSGSQQAITVMCRKTGNRHKKRSR